MGLSKKTYIACKVHSIPCTKIILLFLLNIKIIKMCIKLINIKICKYRTVQYSTIMSSEKCNNLVM